MAMQGFSHIIISKSGQIQLITIFGKTTFPQQSYPPFLHQGRLDDFCGIGPGAVSGKTFFWRGSQNFLSIFWSFADMRLPLRSPFLTIEWIHFAAATNHEDPDIRKWSDCR